MLATYPDVFAGGGIIAGLPYGAAGNVQQAFESMYQSPPRPARVWGDLVRAAAPHSGPWPRVSVWHGGSDATVIPANAAEIIKQWTDVLGLPEVPSRTETVDGYPRQLWCDAAGNELIESYTITSMAHGTPLAVGTADDQCGAAGAFLLDVGISSSYHIAKFWGLAERRRAAEPKLPSVTPELADQHAASEPANPASSDPGNIRAIINRALQAAGLMKTP
jgi:feruloyl esterase